MSQSADLLPQWIALQSNAIFIGFKHTQVGVPIPQHDALGRPAFFCAPPLAAELALRGIQQLHLTLSDERAYVLAFVVMEN